HERKYNTSTPELLSRAGRSGGNTFLSYAASVKVCAPRRRNYIIMDLLALLILLSGLLAGWTLGANDAANSMGTAVGARLRTIREAVIIVGVFSLAGALLYGHRVINTIGKGIVPLDQLDSDLSTVIALAAMLAAGGWLFAATYLKLPVSTTHSIVGAVAGAGLAAGNVPIVWAKLLDIVSAWVLTPVGGALVAYVLYQLLRLLVLKR